MPAYIRLTDYKDSDSKEQGFFKPENRYSAKQEDFDKIPGSPIAYWVSNEYRNIFENNKNFKELNPPRIGMMTTDNNRFLKYWFEVSLLNIGFRINSISESIESKLKWFIYQKGGGSKKWYGNNEYVVNWFNAGKEIVQNGMTSFRGKEFYFKKGITWSDVNTNDFVCRLSPGSYLFDIKGTSCFPDNSNLNYMLSFLNSRISTITLNLLNPTISYQSGDISRLPIIFPKQELIKQLIDTLTQECIDISKEEWDSRETSWDFKTNELLRILGSEALASHSLNDELGGVKTPLPKLETVYNKYCEYWREKFFTLHKNEEELNRLFIDIYELQDELTPDVALKDITILKQEADIVDGELVFNADEIIKQFISYGVGVMFGRYSLDYEGLVVANLNQDYPKDTTFSIDDDNIIPVLEDDYFSDDIASRFVSFVKVAFGEVNLNANVAFIEKALGKTIRAYFVKDFYEDHLRRYKKRPIYWMVASPKKGFMALMYMHRYQSDIFARVQNSYLREYIAKLEATKEVLNLVLLNDGASSRDKKEADKNIKNIEQKLKELFVFDRDVLTKYAQQRQEIDLDDGVKVNYTKFKDVLYEIKGLSKG